MTWMRFTHTEPVLTSPTCEPGLADTEVVIRQLDAVKTVRGTAGIRQTLIYVPLTSLSCESRRTVATIAAYSVHTGAIVQTLWWGIVQPQRGTTIIFIDLTENTQCARRTGADVMSHQVNTGASILTWMRLALIEL